MRKQELTTELIELAMHEGAKVVLDFHVDTEAEAIMVAAFYANALGRVYERIEHETGPWYSLKDEEEEIFDYEVNVFIETNVVLGTGENEDD